MSDCGTQLHVSVLEGCQDNLWYWAKLPETISGKLELNPVVTKFNAEYEYITNDGDIVYIRTNKDAPNYRVAKVDLKNAAEVDSRSHVHISRLFIFVALGKLD